MEDEKFLREQRQNTTRETALKLSCDKATHYKEKRNGHRTPKQKDNYVRKAYTKCPQPHPLPIPPQACYSEAERPKNRLEKRGNT